MADEQVTAALSTMSLSEREPPTGRLNFPLPRELRDQIYGYLLDSEYTRVQKKSMTDPDIDKYRDRGLVAYKFHTAILAVNRTIGSEAKELMYKRNIFVVLSYQWPSPDTTFESLLWLPTVSTTHVNRMQLHSLRIHHSITPANKSNIPIKSCIILADDLEAFCCAARAATEERIAPGVQLTFKANNTYINFNGFDRTDPLYSIVKCLCDLRDTECRPMDQTLQHRLLAPLSAMKCVSQHVIFKGANCDANKVAHLKQLIAPSFFCFETMLLSELQTLIMAKDIADASVEHDELAFVLARYETISERLAKSLMDESRARATLECFPKIFELQEIMVLEVLINVACGKLKSRELDAFQLWFDMAGRILGRMYSRLGTSWIIPDGIVDYHYSLGLWCTLYCDGHLITRKMPAITVGEAVRQLEILDGLSHQAHDLKILRSYPDQQATVTAEILPYDRCSVSQLPFPATSFYKNVDSLKQYTQSRGWYDVSCLKTMDGKTKTHINLLQKKHDLHVTDFDLLYAYSDQGDKAKKS